MARQLARREFLQHMGRGTIGTALVPVLATTAGCLADQNSSSGHADSTKPQPGSKGEKTMAFTLPDLPYDFNALEPHIDEQTMRIHHGKHHGAYVTNLNNALKDHADWAGKSLDEVVSNITKVPEAVRTAVRNNGGGHWNHSFFWPSMGPAGVGGGEPKGSLASAIKDQLGGLDAFKDAFTKAAMGRFGSGWAWLCVGANKKLAVCSTPNQDNPLMAGVADITGTPILGLDVWEHAYYLKYQNRRPDYIAAWWSVVNWGTVAERFAKAMG